jgi:hypothetical protein
MLSSPFGSQNPEVLRVLLTGSLTARRAMKLSPGLYLFSVGYMALKAPPRTGKKA